MSCPHGVWHEEDCEVCAVENKLSEATALLQRIEQFPENMLGDSLLRGDVRRFLTGVDTSRGGQPK